jgi:Holliday junction resolvasome RuvABC endonuclease subunit
MPGVLALDLATIVGWCIGPLPRRPLTLIEATVQKPPQPLSGIFRVAAPGASVGRFLAGYGDWLQKMFEAHGPQGVIFESPILPQNCNVITSRKLIGLAGVTEMSWVREVQPSTVKLHISGYGGPGKEHVKQALISRGWSFADDNEADALAIHDFAGHLFAKERR